ncbi:phage tail protein [Desulfovibrio subterraneus]|uniref:Uncharacterized protein n=1 Tax=Desulfovibrio subterraneus TaxID=2718620 RepID=A0A7J0BM10_9BACT|nr:phage tail protein [Desulfovibrio subterraneus]GFM34195.1 hypothetical protein DSM101010T_25600 [Desulfovibrio subterraneus]
MATVITLAGESLIARKQAAGVPLQIDAFVLALVPGLDPDLPVDRSEGKPDAAQIVHTYQIPDEYRGYVNPNQVVYSMLLGSDLGNFSFNWLGLYSSADDVVVAISHLPEMAKWKTDTATNAAGNNLTRNMLLEFSGAQVATGITIQAATWQVDFTARMRGIDERERRSNRDIYGRACFFADAAKVVNNAGAFSLQAGTLYVEGVRAAFAAMPLEAGSLPKKVWLDVGLVQQGADMVADMAVNVLPPEQAAPDYADGVGNARYRVPLAEIAADGTVTDLRRTEGVVTDLVAYLLENGGAKEIKEHLESASPHGLPLAGGEPGQVLIKQEDGSIVWGNMSGVAVGDLCWSSTGKPSPGCVAANVKQKFVRGLYPQLVARVLADGGYLTDEAAWDAEAAAQEGSCGCYALTDTHIILPCYKHYFAAAQDGVAGKEVGDWAGDAIRNITGAVGGGGVEPIAPINAADVAQSGALTLEDPSEVGGGAPSGTGMNTIRFDASRVVPTADENRPKTVYLLPCIKVADVAVNAAQVDLLALAAQVAQINGDKVDRSEWVELVPDAVFKRPDGIIEQYGEVALPATTNVVVTLPVTFPNKIIDADFSFSTTSSIGLMGKTVSSITLRAGGAGTAYWRAIGR